MKQKSIKNIRKEFKENGIFYTPPELAKKLLEYVDIKPKSVYDPTCGAGNLLKAFPDEVKKYGQEIDEEQIKLIDIPNFTGYAGDALIRQGIKEEELPPKRGRKKVAPVQQNEDKSTDAKKEIPESVKEACSKEMVRLQQSIDENEGKVRDIQEQNKELTLKMVELRKFCE